MFKKIVILLIITMLFGCISPKSQEDLQFDRYEEIYERLMNQKIFEETDDFVVRLIFNQLDNEYRYDLIIDDPKNVMYDITAMCYVDENSDKMLPNIGIFDTKAYHLKKNHVDKARGFYKGIQLSGKSLKKDSLKLYIHYYLDEEKKNDKEMFIEVKDEIR